MDKAAAAKGAAWTMLFSTVSKVIFPIVGIIITGRVGVEAVGLFGIIMTLYTIAELFRDGGLAVTYIAEGKGEAAENGLFHGVAIASGALFALAVIVARQPLEDFFQVAGMANALVWTAVVILLGSIASIPGSTLIREGRFRESGLADVIAAGVGYLVALILALAGFGILALLVQMIVRGVLYVAFIVKFAGWIRPRFQLSEGLRLFRRSMANLGTNIAYTVYTMGDYAVISKLLGASATGAYFVAYNLASKPFDLVTGPLSRTMFVAMNRAKGDRDRQSHLLARTISAVVLFSLPIYVLTAAHAEAIVGVLYPDQFADAGPCLLLLSAYLGVRTLGSPAGSALISSGNARLNVLAWVPAYIIAASGIIFNLKGITLLEIVMWLSIGAVTVYGSNIVLAFRVLGIRREDAMRMVNAALTCGVAVAIILACRLLPFADWQQLICATVLGGLAHVAWIGRVRLSGWTRGFSRHGLKELYESL